ncbi:MAG: hypothetical protein AB7U82_34880 [Blastocatellales bacterium]
MTISNTTAVEAANRFIQSMPASFVTFVSSEYSLTVEEARQAAARFSRELEEHVERERRIVAEAERILARFPEWKEAG